MKRLRAIFTVLAIFAGLMSLTGCGRNKELHWTGVAEGESYAVASPVAERLMELSAKEGDFVHEGDLLGRIDTTTLQLQIDSLNEKITQLDLQAKDLAGQISVSREAEALARSTLRRYKTLSDQEGVSRQTLDELELKAEQAAVTVSTLEIKKDTLASQRADLAIQIRGLEESVSRADLTAPADGIVDKVYFNTGEYVPALRTVIEVVDMENLWCMIYIPESRLGSIKTGTGFIIRAGGETLSGTVAHINSRAEFTPRELLTPDNRQAMAYGVKIRFTNNRGVVKIGMPVDLFLNDAEE